MKKTNKYVKTRGQRLALEQASSKPQETTPFNQQPVKPSSALTTALQLPPVAKRPKGRPKKIKRIVKDQSPQQKNKKAKLIKHKIVKKYKTKSAQLPISHTPLKKIYQKAQSPKQKLKVKHQVNIAQQTDLLQGLNKPKGKQFKIKLTGNIPKQAKSEDKTFKKQNTTIRQQISAQKNHQGQIPKNSKSLNKYAKQSKSKITIANQDSPTQQNNSIKLEPEVQKKKKGRPRKIIQPNVGTKIEQRTLDEQKFLDAFVQNAIKIRKLKNERQFFQCFSRIIEYMRDSWEYGELNKSLKTLPRPQDILKIGIQITRGVRKQLQIQAMSQVV